MCRSSAEGGRRCPRGSAARTRALGTARKQVERARKHLDTARAHGDTAAIEQAQHRLQQAKQHLAATHAAHPRENTAGHQRGHDTTANETPREPDTSSMVGGTATVGVRAAGDVSGATVVMTNGHTTVTGDTGTAGQAEEVRRRAREQARQARQQAQQARQQARTQAVATAPDSGAHASTVHHRGGSITNVAAGTVGIQAAREHGNTVHTD